jgi:hypothetical protein
MMTHSCNAASHNDWVGMSSSPDGQLSGGVLDNVRNLFQSVAQTLFAIEGTGQAGLGANFGDGFNTGSAASGAAANPNPFFQELLTKPYRGDACFALRA